MIKPYIELNASKTPNWAAPCGIPCNPCAQPGDFYDPFNPCNQGNCNQVDQSGSWMLPCNQSIPGGWGSQINPCGLEMGPGNCMSGSCGSGMMEYGIGPGKSYTRPCDLEVPFVPRCVVACNPCAPFVSVSPDGCGVNTGCSKGGCSKGGCSKGGCGKRNCKKKKAACCDKCANKSGPCCSGLNIDLCPTSCQYIEYGPPPLPPIPSDPCYAPWVKNLTWLRRTYAGRYDRPFVQ